MSSTLRLKESHLPITAIGYAANCILTGEGSDLCVYDGASRLLLGRYAVFAGQQIHGIAACDVDSAHEPWLLIWGGNLLCLAKIIGSFGNGGDDDQTALVSIDFVSFKEAEDWILDIAFCPYDTYNAPQVCTAILVTAHNAVYAVEYGAASSSSALEPGQSGDSPSLTLSQLSPRSRSISYTGRVSWMGPKDALIVLGTAFGEVFVLACSSTPSDLHTGVRAAFLAHEGSVFGLSLSEPVQSTLGEPNVRYLVTCSDDRTVRVWNLEKMLADNRKELATDHNSLTSRIEETTGFAAYRSVDDAHVSVNASSLASAMGHVSRVWHLHTLVLPHSEKSRATLQITSLGEDATCQVWEFKRQEDSSYCLTSVTSDRHHGGRNIWSSAQIVRRGACQIVTGGADGGLISRKIGTRAELDEEQRSLTWTDEDLAQIPTMYSDATHPSAPANDSVRSYALFANDAALACTNSGRILMLDRHESGMANRWRWRVIGHEQYLRGFSVATGLNSQDSNDLFVRQHVLIGGSQGHLYMASRLTGRVELLHKAESKIALILAPPFDGGLLFGTSSGRPSRSSGRPRIIVLAYVQNKLPDVFLLDNSAPQDPDKTPSVLIPLKICGSVEDFSFKLSSATITSVAIARDLRYLHAIFGTRDGSIFSVRLMPANERASPPADPHKGLLIPDGHGRDAVTDLILHNDSSGDASDRRLSDYLYSVGRDGTLTVHKISFGDKTNKAQRIHKLNLPFGPNIEEIHLNNGRQAGLFVSGFAGSRFVLFDVLRQREVLSTNCGGSHRIWSFCPSTVSNSDGTAETEGGTLIWTQAGKTCLRFCDDRTADEVSVGSRSHTIKQGHHGREIKASDVVICQADSATRRRHSEGSLQVSPARLPALTNILKTLRSFFVAERVEYSLVATGAEDTDIRIHAVRKAESPMSGASMECVAVLKRHQTGINCLRWSRKGDYLFSSGGCEEFFVWKITPTPLLRYSVYCESVCPDLTADADLRITSFSVYESPELTDDRGDESWFLITMAFSNSMIRIYRYSPALNGNSHWSSPITSSYTSCCITQMEYVASDDGSLMLLTAGTDGHLAIWDLSVIDAVIGRSPRDLAHQDDQLRPFKVLKLHQNAIKTLITLTLDERHTLVITGGDDNAISIVLLRMDPGTHDIPVESLGVKVVQIPSAHAAAVSACVVRLLPTNELAGAPRSFTSTILNSLSTAYRLDAPPPGNKYQVEVISSSNDQKMKCWQVSIDTKKAGAEAIVAVQRTNKQCTGVADVSGLNWLSESSETTRDLLVTGVGMEIWGTGSSR